MRSLTDLGVLPIRRQTGGGIAPHISILFRNSGVKMFGIDTTPPPAKMQGANSCEIAYLITHAHSDHYGRSSMRSEKAVASNKTARALEIRYGKRFAGETFSTGERIDVNGVEVETFETRHTPGSNAYFWENEVGSRILVTGDVKDFSALPECDVLIMEATYGDPYNSSCCFEDDLDAFKNAINGGVAFGAYSFGKAQRAVQLLRDFGYRDCIEMSEEALVLTKQLMDGAEPVSAVGEDSASLCVVSPRELDSLTSHKRFILTAQNFYRYGRIKISDHLDFRGLMQMVKHCSPEYAIVYHPCSAISTKFAQHLDRNGLPATAISQIGNILAERLIEESALDKFY